MASRKGVIRLNAQVVIGSLSSAASECFMPNLACIWANKLLWLGVSAEWLKGLVSSHVRDRCPKWEPCQSSPRPGGSCERLVKSRMVFPALPVLMCYILLSISDTNVWHALKTRGVLPAHKHQNQRQQKKQVRQTLQSKFFQTTSVSPFNVTRSGKQVRLLYMSLGCYTDNSSTQRWWWWEPLF